MTRRLIGLASILSSLAGAACSGQEVFDVRDEAAGAHCPAGGNAVLGGVDRNRNGKLDASEVQSTKYICNGANGANGKEGANGKDGANGEDGADGKNALIRSENEPIGIACPTGGAKYSSGLDVDTDGVLADSEVTSVQFICNGVAGQDGANGLDTLVSLLSLDPQNGSCPSGGKAIYSGRDRDGDGLLDPDEVEQTSFLCDGADGASALTQQAPEPAGENCAFGGSRIDSGLDADADGVLGEGEATQTSYVCHGAPGAPGSSGADGRSTLVAVSEQPAGAECATGGARIDTGADLDADGQLSAAEVQGTSYVCDGAQGAPGEPGDAGAGGEKLLQRTSFGVSGCPNGGVSIESGLDTNQDDVLDEAEVTASSLICDATLPWQLGSIAVGDAHACASLSDGSVQCWGDNRAGQLGDGTGVSQSNPSTSVLDLAPGALVAAGGHHSCAVSNGNVQCWGQGPLGDGQSSSSSRPVSVMTTLGDSTHPAVPLDGVVGLALGSQHSCALRTDGTVWCWGINQKGQLGRTATGAQANLPGAVREEETKGGAGKILVGVVAIASGNEHTCALLSTGSVRCWGANAAGQLGGGDEARAGTLVGVRVKPKSVDPTDFMTEPTDFLTDAIGIEAGGDHTCAVLKNRTIRCWGRNNQGELGTDSTASLNVASTPVLGITNARSVAAGRDHSCALVNDGSVRCWGGNQLGQLGNASMVQSSKIPVNVSLRTSVAALDAGPLGLGTCARLSDGQAWCWGADDRGQLGDGLPNQGSTSPVLVSSIH